MNHYKTLTYLIKSLNPLLSHSASSGFLRHGGRASVISNQFCSEVTKAAKVETQISSSENQDSVAKIDGSDQNSLAISRFNFAMIANESSLIQKFVDLGVNLYEIQKRPEEAQLLITQNLDKVERYVSFLTESGVPPDKIGKVITKNPLLFKEDLDDLQVRVNYLWSKKFDKEMIGTIISRNPKWLTTPVRVIDVRLGFLQQTFKLKAEDVREIVTKAPGVALVRKQQISESIFALKEEMGLDEHSLKQLVKTQPSLLRRSPYDFIQTFEYLTKTMKVSLDLILKQPKILTYRKHLIQDRHKFLVSLGRAQYNNLLPGYVCLDNLTSNDDEFCEKVAKTTVDLYYEFLKTL